VYNTAINNTSFYLSFRFLSPPIVPLKWRNDVK